MRNTQETLGNFMGLEKSLINAENDVILRVLDFFGGYHANNKGEWKMRRTAQRLAVTALVAGAVIAGLTACTPGSAGKTEPTEGTKTEMPTNSTAKPSEDVLLGTWTIDQPGNPTLTFEKNGKVSGTDGCNNIMGDFAADGAEAKLNRLASTLRACQGVDDWLRNASKVRADGDTLHVFDTDDQEIGTLSRKA